MVFPAFDGNKLYGATISYDVAPNGPTGYAGWLGTLNTDYQTNAASTGPFHSQGLRAISPWWSNIGSAGTTRVITFQLQEPRSGNWFIVKGYSDGSSFHIPQALQLEHSDNGSSWTSVETLSGLTTGASEAWGVWFDISAAGQHLYWRVTVTQGGDGVLVGHAAMLDVRPINDRASYTSNRVFTLDGWALRWIESGDADYTVSAVSNPSWWRNQFVESRFTWLSLTAGQDTTLVLDCQVAADAGRMLIVGFADATYARPRQITIAYSDNGSSWTDLYDTGALAATANGYWVFDVDLEGESHRYWRATFENGGTGLQVDDFQIYASSSMYNWAVGREWTWGTTPSQEPTQAGFLFDADLDTDWPGATGNVRVVKGRSEPGGNHAWTTGQMDGFVDLGAAKAIDYFCLQPNSLNGTERTPDTITLQWSDNASAWTTIKSWSSLSLLTTNGWILVAVNTGGDAHRYWRFITNRASGFHGVGSVEVWAQLPPAAAPTDDFSDTFPGSDGAPWNPDKWNQDTPPGGGRTVIDGGQGNAGGNSGNANSGGRGRGNQGHLPNQELTGTFQLCETGEPCRGALWLQTSDDWEDLDNPTQGYGVYLPSDSDTASLVVANAGVVTTLDTATWPRDTGLKQYRFRRQSNKVRFRIWDDGDPEPSTWTLTGDDSSITPGDAGAFQVAYTCPTAPSVDACALFDDITVGENNTNPDSNGGNGGRGCCNGRSRRCCRRNRATQ